jgi:dUTP pyrophosphatase
MELNFQKVRNVKSPSRGTGDSAGIDFYLPDNITEDINGMYYKILSEKIVMINPGGDVRIPSGLKMKLPKGWSILLVSKSGISVKKGLIVGACLIDEDFQGEWNIHLINATVRPQTIEANMKIIQGIFINTCAYISINEVKDNLYDSVSERGEGKFGSTGE